MKHETQNASNSSGKNNGETQINYRKDIEFYTNSVWNFGLAALWNNRQFSELETNQSKKYIREYFKAIPKDKFKTNSKELFQVYCERILLAKQYIQRSKFRFLPPPYVWFDKDFKKGFAGTLNWYQEVKEKRKSGEHLNNLKQTAELYIDFVHSPSVTIIRKAGQILSKPKDRCLLNAFYASVFNHNIFTAISK